MSTDNGIQPAESDSREADIYIVGLGINGIEHVTRETESVCRRSSEILAVATHPAVLSYLETLCPKVTNLHALSYREDEHRGKAYDTMSASVLSAALERPPVTFAVYGHPMVYVYPSRQILEAAPYLGLTVRVLPAVSSLDTMFVDLGIDPGVDGLQMYEATDVLVRRRPLQPDVPCLLWQVGTVESVFYSTAASKPDRFFRIKEYLLRFYPPEHELIAVHSTLHPLLDPSVYRFRLGEMEQHHEHLHQGLTVYIPPVTYREAADLDLVEKIESLAHLENLVESPAVAAK
jgi:uncharacterized protein YabN with tetrapyrrole methylase and pyrophosphatase domain